MFNGSKTLKRDGNRKCYDLETLENKFQSLLNQNISSVAELEEWLIKEQRLTAEVEEVLTSQLIAVYRDTKDSTIRNLHKYNQNSIQPLLKNTMQNLIGNLVIVRFQSYWMNENTDT